MADIDVLLSASLKRIAQPGDAAGVADAIRARVDAGDTGTPASSSGFGAGVGSWLPWVGLVVVAGIAGGAAGVAGFAGHPVVDQVQSASSGAVAATTPGLLCVDGATVITLPAGERVIAVARDEQSAWVGVRNPVSLVGTVWVSAADVAVDDGQAAIDSLPVGGACPTLAVAVDPAPVIAAPAPVTPGAPSAPDTPDTTAPSIGKPVADTDPVCSTASGSGDHTSTISVSASDDVGVAAISISWSGAASGSSSMSGGDPWTYTFTSSTQTSGAITFTVQASDGAGNMSQQGSVTIQQLGCVF